jgi:hypothetical protein
MNQIDLICGEGVRPEAYNILLQQLLLHVRHDTGSLLGDSACCGWQCSEVWGQTHQQ